MTCAGIKTSSAAATQRGFSAKDPGQMLHLDLILPTRQDFNLLFFLKITSKRQFSPKIFVLLSAGLQGWVFKGLRGGRRCFWVQFVQVMKGDALEHCVSRRGSREASLQFEAGLARKIKQIWRKKKSLELSLLLRTPRCCQALGNGAWLMLSRTGTGGFY